QMLPADIRPRLCHIMRDKSGFGFGVSGPEGTKGTFQLSVQQGGPAERAGVPPGSWLLELNGASVRSYSHAQLARKVGSKVTLLVATSAVEEFYRLRGLRVMAALGPAGYGFLLKEDDCSSGATGEGAEGSSLYLSKACLRVRNIPTCAQGSAVPVPLWLNASVSISPPSLCPAVAGQFLWDVDAGLPAEQAGMKEGDRLLAVNGESIEGLDHQQTVLRIRAHDDQVTLLVIDPAGDEFYQSVGFGDSVWSRPGWGALGGGCARRSRGPGAPCLWPGSSTQHLDPDHLQLNSAPCLAPWRAQRCSARLLHAQLLCLHAHNGAHSIAPSRDPSPLTETDSKLLLTKAVASCNLKTDLCLCLPSCVQGYLGTLH
uniref:PDZ domain-containing protein n=1 Tax=Bubo bubo TaxID=30461 RepID=A0A8C0EYQ7_BUBBB